MILIIETPQRADMVISHTIEEDVLTIAIDGISEAFDFTDFPEGRADEIIPDILPVNPIVSAEKQGDTVTVTLIRFYGVDEKEVYENA
jgi:hypothetical protein